MPRNSTLDIALLQQADEDQRGRIGTGLEIAETLCLRLCDEDTDYNQIQPLSPNACGALSSTKQSPIILEQIDSLLRIKAAEIERNRAHEQLILHRMEVEEGLRSAAQIQHALLPNHIPPTDNYRFA